MTRHHRSSYCPPPPTCENLHFLCCRVSSCNCYLVRHYNAPGSVPHYSQQSHHPFRASAWWSSGTSSCTQRCRCALVGPHISGSSTTLATITYLSPTAMLLLGISFGHLLLEDFFFAPEEAFASRLGVPTISIKRARTWVKHRVPRLLLPSA